MTQSILNREQELEQLTRLYQADEAEFLAVYGRRRIGKTYLIREYFKNEKCLYFEVVGMKNGNQAEQLSIFQKSFDRAFSTGFSTKPPEDWPSALEQLSTAIENLPKSRRVVLFFDELPWLAAKRGKLIEALDHYWNTRWSKHKKLLCIACGSAATWMIHHLINAKGGLHNRVTAKMHMKPFTLKETSIYFSRRGFSFSNRQILQLYLALGGVPYYLRQVIKNKSVARNINQLCFNNDAPMATEFDKLFASLFEHHQVHVRLIREIAANPYGISRMKLSQTLTFGGGRLTKRLQELELAGFIHSFTPYGYSERGLYYRVIDEYVLFYLSWIEPYFKKFKVALTETKYWEMQTNTPRYNIWAGYAFEALCVKHVSQIIEKLDIAHLVTAIGPWRAQTQADAPGAQIDLVIERNDDCVNLCEIKFYKDPFVIDKAYAEKLLEKGRSLTAFLKTKRTIIFTFITVEGIKDNTHSRALPIASVTLDDLITT